jgi:two-component system, NtrC family, sensor histidine kinase HydH
MGVAVTTAILASIVSGAVAVAILFRRPRQRLYRYFAAFTAALFFWHASAVASGLAGGGLPHLRVLAALCVSPTAGLFFRELLRDRTRMGQRLNRAAILLSGLLLLAVPLSQELAARALVGTCVLANCSLVLHGLYSRIKSARIEETKRLRLLFYGGLVTLVFTTIAVVPGSGPGSAAAGNIAATAYIYFLYQSLLARRLVDLVEILGKAAVLGTLTLLLAAIYALLVLWFGSGQQSLWLFNTLVASFVILILYDQVRTWIEELTAQLLFRERFELKQVLRRLLRSLRTTIALPEMRDQVLEKLHGSGRASQVSIYLQIEGELSYGLFGFRGNKPPDTLTLAQQPALLQELRRERKPLLFEHLIMRQQDLPTFLTRDDPTLQREIERIEEATAAMRQLAANAIIPMIAEDRIAGLLCLGTERVTEAYATDELSAFLSLAEACAVIIENSKEYEKRRERDRLAAIGEMAAGMAHEIRNPLGAIKGAAQCLDPSSLPKESQEFVDVIIEEVNRLNRVVGGFLEYARPYRGNPITVKVNDVVNGTLKLLSSEALPATIKLERLLANDLPEVLVDPEQLKQVLINLLLNAVQAMPEGGTITVSTMLNASGLPAAAGTNPRLSDTEQVLIRVRDTGAGIRPEDLTRVFVPFFTTKASGTGLGLAISQRIVQNAGGRLEVSSRPMEGATFTLRLPGHPREAARAAGDATGEHVVARQAGL